MISRNSHSGSHIYNSMLTEPWYMCMYMNSPWLYGIKMFTKQHVREIVRGLGGENLAWILFIIALNPRVWTTGMPDLILWGKKGVVDVEVGGSEVRDDRHDYETPNQDNDDDNDCYHDDEEAEVDQDMDHDDGDLGDCGDGLVPRLTTKRTKLSYMYKGPDIDIPLGEEVVVMLVEVKSKRDTLSHQQQAWLSALNKKGIPAIQLIIE